MLGYSAEFAEANDVRHGGQSTPCIADPTSARFEFPTRKFIPDEFAGSEHLEGACSISPHPCYNVFMANTRSATLSVRLKPATKKRLAKLAEASGRSSNFLIADAVDSYVADQERLLAEIRVAGRQVKSGHYIRQEDMKAWLLSWGTRHELPPPRCVCGKVHDAGAA
jgi:RHH-type rel operon transcriptional repressor/antitoxin RelB